LTPEEKAAKLAKFQERMRLESAKKTGGVIRRQNSAKGAFVVLNAQKAVSETDLAPIVSTLDKLVHVNASVKQTTVGISLDNVKTEIKSAGGTVGVALVESDRIPSFLAAPEDGWVLVNVRPLVKGVDKRVAAARVRKEALRAYAFVAGGIYVSRGPILMRGVAKPEDLDSITREVYSIDVLARMNETSSRFGITPWHQTSYRRACTEGWAPAPTNDFQKAIWDEVHAMPTSPMKILPESRKQQK